MEDHFEDDVDVEELVRAQRGADVEQRPVERRLAALHQKVLKNFLKIKNENVFCSKLQGWKSVLVVGPWMANKEPK